MKILIDSDVISSLGKPSSIEYQQVTSFLSSFTDDTEVCLSMLTIYEMEYSLAAFTDTEQKEKAFIIFNRLKESLTIINLSFESAKIYGEIKQNFKRRTGIKRAALKRHNIDIALASVAIANDCLLISQDSIYQEHLQAIDPRLQYKNWAVP